MRVLLFSKSFPRDCVTRALLFCEITSRNAMKIHAGRVWFDVRPDSVPGPCETIIRMAECRMVLATRNRYLYDRTTLRNTMDSDVQLVPV
jgi:hypothetical protein